MIRLTLRNLAATKARFAMTTFAVVLGVSFVVASFVLSDGLRSTFNSLSEEITSGTDLLVRPVSEFGQPEPLAASLVDDIAALDGVDETAAFVESVENSIQPIKADGTTIPTQGPPQLMFAWIDSPALGSFTVVEGSPPDEHGEFAMDVDAAALHGFELGEQYRLATPVGIVDDFTLVATTSFGEDNATVGATLMHVSLPQAQDLFGAEGAVSGVVIDLAPGSDAEVEAVTASVAALVDAHVGAGAELVDNSTILAEQQAEFDVAVTIVGNILLGFAIVSLFVSIFIIYNTFAIVLGQRIREMALLRAIGAGAKQLRRSVMAEALVVGTVASGIGLGFGLVLARLLTALFAAIGAELPDYPTIVAGRTVLVAFGLGVGVTLLAAIMPARTAASIPPVAALRDEATGDRSNRRRSAVGVALGLIGVALGSLGLFGPELTTLNLVLILGAAAVLVFVGITLASPVLARPVTAALGWPLRTVAGRTGGLAAANASRNPRRTATTGAALMIGLALVTTGYVVGESVKSGLGELLSGTVSADYLITENNGGGIAPAVADELEASGHFEAVLGVQLDSGRLGGAVHDITATDLDQIETLFDIGIDDGALPSAETATSSVVLPADVADELALTVGDRVPLEQADGSTTELTVAAVFSDTTIFNQPIVAPEVLTSTATPVHVFVGAVLADGAGSVDGGAGSPEAQAFVDQLQARYPQLSIDSAAEFQEQFESTIDDALQVVNVLLALAIVIALLGIANTLALSVHERTRELGLLRAVGMTRRQTRRMVRWEAVLIALFGAVLGVASGLVFGLGAVQALPADTFGGSLAVPMGQLGLVVVVAALATLVAAWLPARRAGRLDVLEAISHA